MPEKIYNYFKGYVRVKITTPQPERFLNMAVISNIYLWEIERPSTTEIIFSVSVRGFKKLRKIVYMVRGRVKILNKRGFFLLLKKFKDKRLILFGLIPVILLNLILSSMILEINVTGNKITETEEILEKLREINLQKFAFRSNIDNDKIYLKLVRELDEVVWTGVYEEGTRLTIEIKERRTPPEIIPKNEPCHIVAKKDGVIRRLITENGDPLVRDGHVVKKGQVLISGIIISPLEGLRYLHSMGSAIAEINHEESLDIKLYEYKKNYTDNIYYKLYFKDLDLTPNRIVPFYNYDERVKRYTFSFFDLRVKKYLEYTLFKEPVSYEEAVKKGKEALTDELFSLYNKESIKNYEFKITNIDEETVNIKLSANILEDIAEQRIIRKETN